MVGVGFTVMVKVCEVPIQALKPRVYVGVTVMVEDIDTGPLFVAVNAGKLPVPLESAKPIAVLLLVHV